MHVTIIHILIRKSKLKNIHLFEKIVLEKLCGRASRILKKKKNSYHCAKLFLGENLEGRFHCQLDLLRQP